MKRWAAPFIWPLGNPIRNVEEAIPLRYTGMITDMRQGGAIYADGVRIYENGKFNRVILEFLESLPNALKFSVVGGSAFIIDLILTFFSRMS